jgi:hypothetical protein
VGDGPRREVASELLKMVITENTFAPTPSNRYRSVLPRVTSARSREVCLTAAGFACLLHIVWTRAAPFPVSPFLIFALLTDSPRQLVHLEFLHQLDQDEENDQYHDYFRALQEVQNRFNSQVTPVLAPFENHIIHYRELSVCPMYLDLSSMIELKIE